MKKVAYLFAMILTVALMSTSCDPIEDPTLEELNPEWTSLSWVSTDGYSDVYPQLTIEIQGNDVIVTLVKFNEISETEYFETQTYNEFTVTVDNEDEYNKYGTVVIGDEYSGTTYFDGEYRIDYSEVPVRFTIDVENNPYYDDHRYVLEAN